MKPVFIISTFPKDKKFKVTQITIKELAQEYKPADNDIVRAYGLRELLLIASVLHQVGYQWIDLPFREGNA